MRRIYQERSYGKELVGFDYKGYFIEIEYELRGIYGATKKWYHVTLKSGEKSCSDRLYDIKDLIDKEDK